MVTRSPSHDEKTEKNECCDYCGYFHPCLCDATTDDEGR